jgi:LacI family transcriptional regulator, fructose operon transcriptional repressor
MLFQGNSKVCILLFFRTIDFGLKLAINSNFKNFLDIMMFFELNCKIMIDGNVPNTNFQNFNQIIVIVFKKRYTKKKNFFGEIFMKTIADVAHQAGVSIATVSRVLSNKPHVRPEIRQKVLDVVAELDYRPNKIASNLRKQKTDIVGLLVADIRNPFFTAMARAIEDSANARKISVFLCNTDEDPEKEQMYLKTLLDENVAGIILSPTQPSAEAYDFLFRTKTPVVTIDRRIENIALDCVLSDNHDSAHLLTTYLIQQGYKNIAALFGVKTSLTGRDRMRGFKLALSENQLSQNPKFAQFAPPQESEAERIAYEWLSSNHRPDAIIAGNSRLTIGIMNAIARLGMVVPKDIALVGFDETAWMQHAMGGISVISQPTYEMGQTAAELLFNRISDSSRPTREVILKGHLIQRKSSIIQKT